MRQRNLKRALVARVAIVALVAPIITNVAVGAAADRLGDPTQEIYGAIAKEMARRLDESILQNLIVDRAPPWPAEDVLECAFYTTVEDWVVPQAGPFTRFRLCAGRPVGHATITLANPSFVELGDEFIEILLFQNPTTNTRTVLNSAVCVGREFSMGIDMMTERLEFRGVVATCES